MQTFLKHIRQTIISGLILMVPIFVLVLLFDKLWKYLAKFGKQFSDLLGIKTVVGVGAASIATSLILIAIFYVLGLLVRLVFVTRLQAWLEENLLQYIPGYLGYKTKIQDKLESAVKARTAVMAKMHNGWRPGFLVSRENGKTIVFIPNSPETEKGEIWVLPDIDVSEIGLADKVFMSSLQQAGKGFKNKV